MDSPRDTARGLASWITSVELLLVLAWGLQGALFGLAIAAVIRLRR